MPFGLENAPMSFQMLMAEVLRGLHWKFVLCYIDDILVFSKNFEEHLDHLDQVFCKLREANLTLKHDKCHFGVEKVMFLGHILSKDGVSVDTEKIEKVQNFPVPKSQTELKSFLGLCNYYRKFVDGFAHIASPFNKLLKGEKRGKFKKGDWTEDCQAAFQKLKDALTSAPILQFPDMNKEFYISCDASGTAIGYVLGQKDDQGREYVIAYGGRALSKDERKWSVREQECLAVIDGIKAYRHYLSHKKFTVYTDHQSLSYLHRLKDPKGKFGRWCMFLENYSYEIIHRPGKQNSNADAISRIPYSHDMSDSTDDHASDHDKPVPSDTETISNSNSPEKHDKSNNTISCEKVQAQVSTIYHSKWSGYSFKRSILRRELTTAYERWSRLFVSFIMTLSTMSCLVLSGLFSEYDPDCSTSADESDSDTDNSCHIEAILEYGSQTHVNVLNKIDEIKSPDMATLQRQCPDLDFLIEYLETRTMPTEEKKQRMCLRAEDQFVMKDGLLYRIYQPKFKGKIDLTEHYIFQLAMPQCKHQELLKCYHDSVAGGGHFGVTRTFEKLRQKYWFPKMYQEIKNYVSACDKCQRTKTDRRQQPPPLHPLSVEDTMSRVHIDILGPLPKTKQGHQYILLLIDSFSKWPEAFPLYSQSAQEIASILYSEYICRYGAPRSIVSDRGRNFMSKLISALCELFQIKRYHTSSYHPQSNATVERANSTLAKVLSAYVDENQTNWSALLPSVMMSFRATPATESSGYSPFQLLFGKEMVLPVDIDLLPKPHLPNKTKQYMDDLLSHLKIVKDVAKQNMELAKEKAKARFDKRARAPDFRINDKVLLRCNATKVGLSSKLTHKWDGPYLITDAGTNFTYKIKHCKTDKTLKGRVNAQRLKPYQEPLESDSASQTETNEEIDRSDSDPQVESNQESSPSSETQAKETENQSDVQPQPVAAPGPESEIPSQTVETKCPQTVPPDPPKPPNEALGSQSETQSKPSGLIWPDRVSKVSRYRGQRCLKCFVAGRKNSEWIVESLIDPKFLEEYFRTHTTAGRKRKRQKTLLFRNKTKSKE